MSKAVLIVGGLVAVYVIYRGSKLLAVDGVRGMRNKNPMNIKDSSINWDGETGENLDTTFEEFENYSDGIRAGAKLLVNYQAIYGLNTIEGIINRYAPPSDNNPTNDYVQYVAGKVGVSSNQVIDVKTHLVEMVKAIIAFEIGLNPFSTLYIKKSVRELIA
jgi:hypothetical protein